MIEQPLALAAVIAATTALGLWLERTYAWAKAIGASLLVIVLGAVLANLDLVTASSPVYSAVSGPITSLAIVWLLLAVNLRDLAAAGPRMLLAFGLAVVATCVGSLTAATLFSQTFPDDTWRLAGVMTGTYAGGGLNFVAVGREVGLTDSLFTAAAASDNVVTALWVGATLLLPVWLRRFYRSRGRSEGAPDESRTEGFETSLRARPFEILALFALALAVLFIAEWLRERIAGVPTVIWVTTLSLLAGQVPAVRRISGAFPLGFIALHLFFTVIGIGSRVSEILNVGLEVLLFTLVVVAVHGLLTFGLGWAARLEIEVLAVASQAAVGGPSTAMALAGAKGWRELVLPGVVAGLLGYAVGNYAGIGIALLLKP